MNNRTLERYPKINIKDLGLRDEVVTTINGQRIQVDYLPSNLGNHTNVPFFICPGCDKRRRELYYKDNEWSCYRCHDLVYYSQQRTKDNPHYWIDKARKEARKIEPDFEFKGLDYLLTDSNFLFPWIKPKYMKQVKYDTAKFWFKMYLFRANEVVLRTLLPVVENMKSNMNK